MDGNKRTRVLADVVFLELNGFVVVAPPSRLHDAMIAIAERRLDKHGLAALFRALPSPAAGPQPT